MPCRFCNILPSCPKQNPANETNIGDSRRETTKQDAIGKLFKKPLTVTHFDNRDFVFFKIEKDYYFSQAFMT
jgi:hypothetical protein